MAYKHIATSLESTPVMSVHLVSYYLPVVAVALTTSPVDVGLYSVLSEGNACC